MHLVAGRDFTPDGVIDVAEVREGDPAPDGSGPLSLERGMEVGHIFQLGRKYAEALGLKVLDRNGKLVTVAMGSYGIGVSRIVAAVAETTCDDKGLAWPVELAPYQVQVMVTGKGQEMFQAAEDLAGKLSDLGLDVLYDDRKASPGVKFTDAELLGMPVAVVIGRGLANGMVEIRNRRTGEKREVSVADAVAALPEASAAAAVPIEPMPTDAAAQASSSARRRALAGTATRTRVSLTVGEDGRPGMHAFRSGMVLPLRRLPLAVEAITEIGLLERSRWRAHYRPGMRIEAIAPSGGEPVVLLDERLLTAQARSTGRRRVREVVDASALGLGELTYSVHAEGFWQVHVDAPRVLVERVVRGALGADLDGAAGSRVLELYSGAGLFTLPLAALVGSGGEVVSLEGNEQAVRDARRTLHDQPSARLASGRVSARSVRELAGSLTGGRPDVVVLDPPRQGAGREVIEAVGALGAERIVLVACDPAALARDLGTLLRSGYALGSMSALDMFPHTHHFETIVVLERS